MRQGGKEVERHEQGTTTTDGGTAARTITNHGIENQHVMSKFDFTDRRTVLKTIGAGVGASAIAGVASAGPPGDSENGGKGGPYGNGNALGKFLNEDAIYKPSPVWDTGIADRTGQSEVDVLWSNLTEVINPRTGETALGPWGIEPRAVKVSPGTQVNWTWYDGDFALDIHHLVSYFDPPYDEEFELPPELGPGPESEDDGDGDHGGGDHDHEHPGGDDEFYVKEDPGDTFSYTFDEVGTYLYFCIPHGIPKGELEMIPTNLFGQRGAVKVVDD